MKKYDKDATCCKCGGGDIEDVHQDELLRKYPIPTYQFIADNYEKLKSMPEFIQRTCKNCGYEWDEGPMDGLKSDIEKDIKEALENGVGIPTTIKWPDGTKTSGVMKDAADAPVIEVGDVVRFFEGEKCHRNECKVIGISTSEGFASLKSTHNKLCACGMIPISYLSLIRKGPKVHTFEGVRFESHRNGMHVTISRDSDKDGGYDLMQEIIACTDNNKRYTLTLTEEAS